MKRRRTTQALYALVLAATAGTAAWLYTSFERVPVQVETGLRGEARRDGLLAARRLFDALGAPARFQAHLQGLPPPGGTLVLLDRPDHRPRTTSSQILDWVRAGGHAVVIARPGDPDPLLAAWDVRVTWGAADASAARARLVPGEHLDVDFVTRRILSHDGAEPVLQVASHVLVFRLGEGRMTALSDHAFFDNHHIGRGDNAAFLWRLTHLDRDGEVWFVTGARSRSIWNRILSRGWPVVTSLALILAVAGWAAGARFGPMLPAPSPDRPHLLDHITASGAFYWREDARGILLDAVRESVLRTVEYRRPGWAGADDRDERIAGVSGLPREQVSAAFAPGEPDGPLHFTEVVATLEHIRKRL